MVMKRTLLLATCMLLGIANAMASMKAVELYTQEELLEMFPTNAHLKRVQQDDCQLLQDIEARASVLKIPAYQMLWADMQLFGICTKVNVPRGWDFLHQAADQGLPDAIEQIGRYHMQGRFVIADEAYGLRMLHLAASLGHQRALLAVAEYYSQGIGSAWDYPDVYQWLHQAKFARASERNKAEQLKLKLAQQLPPSVRERTRVDSLKSNQWLDSRYVN